MAANKFWDENGRRTKEYTDSLVYQLEQWRDGRPIHNTFSNECCPDFSCCKPEMLMERSRRYSYANFSISEIRRKM